MRFERLDILRYGALTDRGLDFRPDARLHVVYGPNEAGKSSALAAISDPSPVAQRAIVNHQVARAESRRRLVPCPPRTAPASR